MRNGPLQAWNVTLTELVFGPLLVAGLLTPLAYAGCASIVLVALVTNHWKNGFFINNPGEGWEYVGTVAVLCIALGGLGPGTWSLDDAFKISFPFEPGKALLVTADRRHRRHDRLPRHVLAAAGEGVGGLAVLHAHDQAARRGSAARMRIELLCESGRFSPVLAQQTWALSGGRRCRSSTRRGGRCGRGSRSRCVRAWVRAAT